MKTLNDLKNALLILLLIVVATPIIIVFAIVFIPYAIIDDFFRMRKRKKELEEALEINDGNIFFLYREYHEYNFLSYFEKNHSEIYCIQVKNYNPENVLLDYLTEKCKSKSYPKLVKIDGENILRKQHYNSFKHYIRRNNNPVPFFELIESSIKNLEKSPYEQV